MTPCTVCGDVAPFCPQATQEWETVQTETPTRAGVARKPRTGKAWGSSPYQYRITYKGAEQRLNDSSLARAKGRGSDLVKMVNAKPVQPTVLSDEELAQRIEESHKRIHESGRKCPKCG